MEKPGRVIVVAGPSGAGKDTLIRKALHSVENVHYSVSATTRSPREGEVDGRDYHFVSEEEFREMIRRGAFLEWEEVFGRFYGTPESEVREALRSGKDVLLELDVKGALEVRNKREDAELVFIMPPSMEELRSRLEKRKGSDRAEPEELEMRTRLAPWEVEVGAQFDEIIVNDDVERASGELATILTGKKTRREEKEGNG